MVAPTIAPTLAAAPLATKPTGPVVYQVSDIVGRVVRVLDDHFADVWIEGEIEGFKRHQVSGNCYFAMKDSAARIDAMLGRRIAQAMKVPLREGMKVRARGRLTLYKEQGRFQFYIEEIELSGEGELLRQFEELKARLQREGLFEAGRKRPLPRYPRVIGIATSQSGAALQDILRIASRRGRVHILVANCAVQGQQAPAQIVAAIDQLAPHCEVIIVGRGGGSVADLWCFNDEAVARAIYRCPVPVVSAVGHEVDFTIADFVADLRAPTPSAAAELCVPEYQKLVAECSELRQRLLRAGRRTLDTARQSLDSELQRSQVALERQLGQRRRLLSQLSEKLTHQHPRTRLLRNRAALQELQQRLYQLRARFAGDRATLHDLQQRLHHLWQRQQESRRNLLDSYMARLDALSPLRVLQRGYAVARHPDGRVVTDASTVPAQTPLHLYLAQGALRIQVEGPLPPAPAQDAESPTQNTATPKAKPTRSRAKAKPAE